MNPSNLFRLKQFQIDKPCPEDWERMNGDEKKRYCDGCGCFVNNLSAMTAQEAEDVLSKGQRVCVRSTTDSKKGVLTKDGWIPRLLLAGAIATAAAGCQTNTGEAMAPEPLAVQNTPQTSIETGSTAPTMGKVAVEPDNNAPMMMGEIAIEPLPPKKK